MNQRVFSPTSREIGEIGGNSHRCRGFLRKSAGNSHRPRVKSVRIPTDPVDFAQNRRSRREFSPISSTSPKIGEYSYNGENGECGENSEICAIGCDFCRFRRNSEICEIGENPHQYLGSAVILTDSAYFSWWGRGGSFDSPGDPVWNPNLG